MTRGAKWRVLSAAVIGLVLLALRVMHVLSTSQAIVLGLVGEIADWFILATGVRNAVRQYRDQRASGAAGLDAFNDAYASQAGIKTASLVTGTLRLVLPFWQWALRRTPPHEGKRFFRYDKPIRLRMWLSIALSVLILIASQAYFFTAFSGWVAWLPVLAWRIVPLWLVILWVGWIRRPHVLDEQTFVLHRGPLHEIRLDKSDLLNVHVRTREASRRGGWRRLGSLAYELPVTGRTNVTVQLRPGASARVFNRIEPAEVVHFFADEPAAVASALSTPEDASGGARH